MNLNDLIDFYGENLKKNFDGREIFEPLKKYQLNINNESLCKLLRMKTGYNWEVEVCMDRKCGRQHPKPWCYDLILTPKNVEYHEGYAVLHANFICSANVVGTQAYNDQQKANEMSKEKLKNANWAELFLNAENRNGTLYCGDWMKEPLPKIVQETLTDFMLFSLINAEKTLEDKTAKNEMEKDR